MTHTDINRALELASHGPGAPVTYWPIKGKDGDLGGEPLRTTTTSNPWALSDGSIVVLVAGKAGGVAIEHLRLEGEYRL